MLNLTPDELLATTRSVRKRLDLERPVEREVLEECLRLAQQAPTSSYAQNWHFVLVTDAGKRAALGELWRGVAGPYLERRASATPSGTWPRTSTRCRYTSSPVSRAGRRGPRWWCRHRAGRPSSRRRGASCWPPAPAAWAPSGRPSICGTSARRPRSSASPSTP